MRTTRLMIFFSSLVVIAALAAFVLFALSRVGPAGVTFPAIDAAAVLRHTTVLSSDEFEGRAPATRGADRTVAYLVEQFKTMGLRPGASDGTYLQPVPLVGITLHNTLRLVTSRNVVAKVEGSDPKVRDECVLYTSHWDHFGLGAPLNGDPVYHGAVDNAVAVAGFLEIARAFAALPVAPRRTVVFAAVTAEEQGMLGSEYYASNPVRPLEKTLAVINLEMLNVHGKTRDLTVVGLGLSDLDDVAAEIAGEQGRYLKPDPEPERGMFYRSDHFSLARRGVPAFEPDHGDDFIGKAEGYGKEVRRDFFTNLYHKPTDTVKPDWDLSGGVQDLQLYWMVGYRVAQADRSPQWKPGKEFHR